MHFNSSLIFLVYLFLISCNKDLETKLSLNTATENKELVTLSKEIHPKHAQSLLEFTKLLQAKDCKNLKKYFEERVFFSLGGESTQFIFEQNIEYREHKYKFPICSLLFEDKDQRKIWSFIGVESDLPTQLSELYKQTIKINIGYTSRHNKNPETDRYLLNVNYYAEPSHKLSKVLAGLAQFYFECDTKIFECKLKVIEQNY